MYSGDSFLIKNMVIRNIGGNFVGSINYRVNLFKDTVQGLNVFVDVTVGGVTINSGATYTIPNQVLGPYYTGSSTPLVTFSDSYYFGRLMFTGTSGSNTYTGQGTSISTSSLQGWNIPGRYNPCL